MRIGRLAQQSGIPVPTIKFYLRAGLLPRGEATARNQAEYDERHLRRLRLADTLLGIGGMTVYGTRAVLAAVDDTRVSADELLRTVQDALPVRRARAVDERTRADARRAAAAALPPDAPASAAEQLAEVYAVAQLLDVSGLDEALSTYTAAAERSAAGDLTVLRAYAARRRLDLDDSDPRIRETLVLVVLLGAVVHSAMTGAARHELLPRSLADPTARGA